MYKKNKTLLINATDRCITKIFFEGVSDIEYVAKNYHAPKNMDIEDVMDPNLYIHVLMGVEKIRIAGNMVRALSADPYVGPVVSETLESNLKSMGYIDTVDELELAKSVLRNKHENWMDCLTLYYRAYYKSLSEDSSGTKLKSF